MNTGGRVIRQEVLDEQDSKSTLRKSTTGTVLIRAEEMKNFVSEWMKTGSGDLVIDESLCVRLNKYTEYQRKFESSVAALLEQELKRYIVDEDYVDSNPYDVINFISAANKVLLTAEVFVDYDISEDDVIVEPKLMRVRDFKRLLASLGNKMISYAYVRDDDLYFDFFLYCKEMGIDLKTKISKSSETRSIQLILPDDRENQNGKSSSSDVQ